MELLECIVLQMSIIHHIFIFNYQDDKAIIDINKVELTEGKLPKNKLRIVLVWVNNSF